MMESLHDCMTVCRRTTLCARRGQKNVCLVGSNRKPVSGSIQLVLGLFFAPDVTNRSNWDMIRPQFNGGLTKDNFRIEAFEQREE